MKFPILSASLLIAASTLLPMSSVAAPFNSSEGFTVAQEQPSEFGGRRGMRGRKGRLMQQLNLSTEQQENIKKIREEYKGKMQDDRQNMRQLKEEMSQLMANGTESQIRSKHGEIQSLKQKLSDTRLEMKLEIRSELTPEQRAQMAQFKQQYRQGRRRGSRG